jgi:hypothetical protein
MNVAETKIVVLKKGREQGREEKWLLDGEEAEVVKEIKQKSGTGSRGKVKRRGNSNWEGK